METTKKTKAIQGLLERLESRTDNSQTPDLNFTDGPTSWGDWSGNRPLWQGQGHEQKSKKS